MFSGVYTHVELKKFFALLRNPSAFRSRLTLVYYGIMAFVSTPTITAADKDAMQLLEPAFENLLHTANLHEDVISATRKEENLDRDMFVALDSAEEGLTASAKDAFGVDPDISFAHNKGIGKAEEGLESGQITSRGKAKGRRCCTCSR